MHLSEKEIPVNPARMGRPPLGKLADDTKSMPVRFEASTLARMKAASLPGESLAAFIRLSVEAELARREKG